MVNVMDGCCLGGDLLRFGSGTLVDADCREVVVCDEGDRRWHHLLIREHAVVCCRRGGCGCARRRMMSAPWISS